MKITLRTQTRNVNFLLIESDGQLLVTTEDGILIGHIKAEDLENDSGNPLTRSIFFTFEVKECLDSDKTQVQAVQDRFCSAGIYVPNDVPLIQLKN